MKTNVLVPLAEGFEDLETVSIVDILRRGEVSVILASIDETILVKGAHGTVIKADALLKDVSSLKYDAIVLPGGALGADNLRRSILLRQIMEESKQNGALICAICAAPTVLVDFGLLEAAQQITCYPSLISSLDRVSANAPVVADGNVITAQGPGSAMLFSLVVLAHLVGESTARKVARGMLFTDF